MGDYLLGLDIGTSAVKAAVFDYEGCLAADALEAYKTEYPAPHFAEQDPGDWWAAVCKAVKSVLGKINPRDISAVGTDGQGWAAVAVDKSGNPLCKTPIWTDTRSTAECARMLEILSGKEWFDICKNPVQPGYSLPKILWYKNNAPEVFSGAEYILQSNSFIGMRLTGNASQDVSQGYAYHFFDMETGRWNGDAMRALGIPASILPDPVPCNTVIGKVTPEAASQTGLPEGIPVVAGGLDAACAALGVGAVKPGMTQEQSGQAGGMSICTESSAGDPRLIMGFHTVPGLRLLQGGTTGGGGALRWLKNSLCPGLSYSQMDELAAGIRAGSDGLIFLPYLAGERSPLWNPDAKGVFFGLTFAHTRAHIIRAVMEGVAFSLRHNLETAANAGAEVSVMRSAGGSSVSRVWTQMKADITGKTIEVPEDNSATVSGAAILAGVGAGIFESEAAAAEKFVKPGRVHTPQEENKEIYDSQYEKYIEIYEHLEPMMRGNRN
ncbi:MAG: FGGY-family carbohydrate kinase [Clostridia bacterium]|nr:FGGY-family carbohydrate kinase [Clostridia bacterium]